MAAMFNVPVAPKSNKSEIEWSQMDLESLPEELALEVTSIHEAEQQIAEMKANFAKKFNSMYVEPIPAGMIRRFSFKFNGLSFGNAVPNQKTGKSKVQFATAPVKKAK
jgi:hypothetical protein